MSLFEALDRETRALLFALVCIPVRAGTAAGLFVLCFYVSFGYAIAAGLLLLGGVGMLFNHFVRDARNPRVWWSRVTHASLYIANALVLASAVLLGGVAAQTAAVLAAALFGTDVAYGILTAATSQAPACPFYEGPKAVNNQRAVEMMLLMDSS